ncbi:uncharacterized protein LOC132758042 [Ruditapes philippinarum]|uniref:uncharacterized protein LOC132758042 n=1 Tax=Ruditapes philippinarum TaxID=129788 RepID=UPI00295B0BDA|nr:uncharacterized protein LOC132758042 [Ruditapes philippinarum]
MASDSRGCFVWLISFKKSCNERFARFRNRLRQRYYARRGKSLDPETLLNETGNAEMVVCKIANKSDKIVPQNLSSHNDDVVDNENSAVIEVTADDKLVEEYVTYIIDKAADTLKQELPSNTNTVTVMPHYAHKAILKLTIFSAQEQWPGSWTLALIRIFTGPP